MTDYLLDRDADFVDRIALSVARDEVEAISVSLPGVVEAFDATRQRANIRIPVKRESRDRDTGEITAFDFPLLSDVPLCLPAFGGVGWAFTGPITAGDPVLVIFLDRDANHFLEDESELRPESSRRFSLSDAVFIPHVTTTPRALSSYQTDAAEIRNDDRAQRVTLHGDGMIEILADTKIRLGDGTEDVLVVLSEAIQLIHDFVDDAGDVANTATKNAANALKARIDSLIG